MKINEHYRWWRGVGMSQGGIHVDGRGLIVGFVWCVSLMCDSRCEIATHNGLSETAVGCRTGERLSLFEGGRGHDWRPWGYWVRGGAAMVCIMLLLKLSRGFFEIETRLFSNEGPTVRQGLNYHLSNSSYLSQTNILNINIKVGFDSRKLLNWIDLLFSEFIQKKLSHNTVKNELPWNVLWITTCGGGTTHILSTPFENATSRSSLAAIVETEVLWWDSASNWCNNSQFVRLFRKSDRNWERNRSLLVQV